MDHTWICACCGQSHDTLPMAYGPHPPDNWFAIPEAERDLLSFLTDDVCVIYDAEYYIRGCLEIPVTGSTQHFEWGVWVSVSRDSLIHMLDRWTAEIAEDEPPRFGWLTTWIKGYPEPHEIRCHVVLRSGALRPLIQLEPTDYPLAVEQHQGITLDRVKDIAATMLHRDA